MSQLPLQPANSAAVAAGPRPRTRSQRLWKLMRSYPSMFIGGFIVLVMIVVAVFAPVLAPHDPLHQFDNGLNQMGMPLGPSHQFLLGTDPEGRDVLSRVIFGARVSLEVGVFAALISLVIGVVLGVVSGYFGGWVDMVIMRFTDIILAFPFLLFVIALVAILQPSVANVYIAIGVLGWAQMARIIRGQVLQVKEFEYVQAARAIGARAGFIIFKEILPNVLAPVIVFTTLNVGTNILIESSLSFLGIGVQPPHPSWGNMLQEGMTVMQLAPWMIYVPGLSLLLAVLGFNLLGDGLRDWLDPRVGK
ncbi:MAG: ABC transporter permease [Alicyclobacillus sp.]|nr:ABC transporter permease [Alicyclobacillus sp.]